MPKQRQKKRAPISPLISMINSMDSLSRKKYAEKCGTSLGNLRQIAYGYGGCSPALAKTIIQNCDCELSFEDLIPELNLTA